MKVDIENSTAPRAVSIREAAALLGISRSFLYELLAAGELPSVRIGRRRLIRPADIDDFLRSKSGSV
jgi:excisionase family DNA binding protein